MIEENTVNFDNWKKDYFAEKSRGLKVSLEPKIMVPKPEFPGSPYEDEMFGNLILGPEYPGLQKQMEQATLFEDKQRISNQISQLIHKANEKHAWHYGPLNKRVQPKIHLKDVIKDVQPVVTVEPVKKVNEPQLGPEPKPANYVDKPEPNLPPIDEPPEEEKGNWLQQKLKKAKKWVKGEVKDLDEYAKRHPNEAWAIGAFAGLAGYSSVLAAEVVMASVLGPAGIIAGVAVGGLINYFGFSKAVEAIAKQKFTKDSEKYNPGNDGDKEAYMNKLKVDMKGRVHAFAFADIVAKLAASIGFGMGFGHHGHAGSPDNYNDAAARAQHLRPTDNYQDAAARAASRADALAHHTPDIGHAPATEIAGTHDLAHNFVQYVVTEHDTWDSLLGEKVVYSPKFIDVLQHNHKPIMDMFTRWAATNGHNGIPIETGADHHMVYRSVDEVRKLLDTVINQGYPTSGTSPEVAKEMIANIERINQWLLPNGTVLELPKP